MTVLESVNDVKARTKLATGRDASATDLLEGFGFTGQKLVTRIGDLSGGEQRRLQLLRLLMDEPTNYLDLATLEELEDALRQWNGTLIIASHDRWLINHWQGTQIELCPTDPAPGSPNPLLLVKSRFEPW